MDDLNLQSLQAYIVRECINQACRLRFPVLDTEKRGEHCPMCGSVTRIVFRGVLGHERRFPWPYNPTYELHAILDNVRSAFNVGSILRAADGAGVSQVHVCGITPRPDNRKVSKTALGSEKVVRWSSHRNAIDAARELLEEGIELWALETTIDSQPLIECHNLLQRDIALIVGNEIVGIDPELLDRCHRVVHIPMHGVKGSLNVAVAFGIAIYWLRGHQTCASVE